MASAASKVPASQFAGLLRRSRFASFDPAVLQSYQAPPANAHRGDWGVKRPISLRRKNAFISLTSFEHHAHFTEWNNAEDQVRFVRRIEEMGGPVTMDRTSAWYKALGRGKNEPPFDSDFCDNEDDGVAVRRMEQPTEQTGQVSREHKMKEEPARILKEVFVTQNIDAMKKREFRRYLRSLRTQRSKFQEYVNAEKKIKKKDLYVLATDADSLYYRRFLSLQMQKEYAEYDSKKIEPQPHPNGAIMYASPTTLETLLWTDGRPGFYLQQVQNVADPSKKHIRETNHVVSFGGITARVGNSAVVDKKVLLDKTTEEGVKQEEIEESVLGLRVNPFCPVEIAQLPRTVGHRSVGLEAVRINTEFVKDDTYRKLWSNPHPLGTREYIVESPPTKSTIKSFNRHNRGTRHEESKATSQEMMNTLETTLLKLNQPKTVL